MDVLSPLVVATVAAVVVAVATVGGLGGAVLLVPVLVLAGTDPAAAVPLGLLSVAAGSLAAAAPQISSGLVNQRLGVVVEVAASAGAVAGAAASGAVGPSALRYVLGAVVVVAAVAGFARDGADATEPTGDLEVHGSGELPGRLAGVGPDGVGYEASSVPAGFVLMSAAGFVAGLSGTSGGYLKTPLLRHVMRVPAKAAAATTTFMVGVTASAALGVLALQGRVDPGPAGAVVLGAIVGGRAGAAAQRLLSGPRVRYVLSAVLIVVGVVIVIGT